MGAFAALFFVLCVICLAAQYSSVRRVIGYSAAVALFVVAGAIAFAMYETHVKAEKSKLAGTKIGPQEIEIADGQLTLAPGRINGSITNKSSHDLESLTLVIRVFDCSAFKTPPASGGPWEQFKECITIGQKELPVRVSVPAGQKRGFERSLYFENLPAVKNWHWTLQIAQVLARI
jgi:hypothetical protein